MKRPFVITDHVRWSDIDFARIIRYDAYLRFYELAEMEMFRTAGMPFSDIFDKLDMWLPRRVLHTEFHSPALLDEELRVVTYITRIGDTSLTINFDVRSAASGTMRAEGYMVLVCTSRKEIAKVPVPGQIRRALEPWVMSVEQARAGD